MHSTGVEDLDQAFALIRQGDLTTATHLTNRVLEHNPNHPYGLLAWGQLLLASGDVNGAVDAHEAAVRFAPIDAHVHFALADSLRARAEDESPFFRAPTWGRARQLAEQGLYLAPDNDDGRRLLLDIIEQQLADVDETKDSTPMDMLPRDRRRHLEVRPIRSTTTAVPGPLLLVATTAFWRSIWWVGPMLLMAAWLIWSWISPAFSWFNLVMTSVLLYSTLLVFRTWLGPRISDRRRTVDF